MFYKAVITSKGLALDAKIKAGQTTAAFTRVKLGDGTYDGQEELKEATDLKNTRNEFGISSIKVIDENTVRIRIVTNNSNLNSGYYISELALFATDPDEGEILYSISLGVPEKMDYQPSEAEMFNATATIDILTSISDAETANIQTGTGAAASAEDLAELETRMEGIETPEFDASGTVEGITGKTTLLASFVTRMPLVKFMRNVVAGFKLVLYAGQVVNNCVTDNAGLPLSAAQGKVLMDLYTVLNTKTINLDYSSRPEVNSVTNAVQMMWDKLYPQTLYLFNHGIIEGIPVSPIYRQSNAFVNVNNESISVGNTQETVCHFAAGIGNAIDITGFSKLVFETSGSKLLSIGIGRNPVPTYDRANFVVSADGTGTIELDVRDYLGYYYIGFRDGNININRSEIHEVFLIP